jgi:hypothetical protein
MHRFLLLLVLAVAAAGQSAEVLTESSLYGTPSASGKVITSLARWSKVEILKDGDPWVLVQTVDYVGWIPLRSIALKTPGITTNVQVPVPSATSPVRQSYQTITVPAPKSAGQAADAKPAPEILTVFSETKTEPVPVATPAPRSAEVAKEEVTGPATGKCKDGTLTHSAEKQGACSNHGGIDLWYADERKDPPLSPTYTPPSSSPGTDVRVRGYYRKDGTYVKPHTRSSPGRRRP